MVRNMYTMYLYSFPCLAPFYCDHYHIYIYMHDVMYANVFIRETIHVFFFEFLFIYLSGESLDKPKKEDTAFIFEHARLCCVMFFIRLLILAELSFMKTHIRIYII